MGEIALQMGEHSEGRAALITVFEQIELHFPLERWKCLLQEFGMVELGLASGRAPLRPIRGSPDFRFLAFLLDPLDPSGTERVDAAWGAVGR